MYVILMDNQHNIISIILIKINIQKVKYLRLKLEKKSAKKIHCIKVHQKIIMFIVIIMKIQI